MPTLLDIFFFSDNEKQVEDEYEFDADKEATASTPKARTSAVGSKLSRYY